MELDQYPDDETHLKLEYDLIDKTIVKNQLFMNILYKQIKSYIITYRYYL